MPNHPIHIGIDISQVAYEGTGVARFTHGLAHTLATAPSHYQYTFFFSGLNLHPPANLIKTIKAQGHRFIRWHIPPRALAYLWNDRPWHGSLLPSLPRFDLFVSSDWTQPPPQIAHKRATIVHDLVFKEYPETVDPLIRDTQEMRLTRVASECDLVLCDSESTRMDFLKWYPQSQALLETIYPGVDMICEPTTTLPVAVRSGEYFLAVGKLEPRKNLQRLIDAFESLQSHYPAYAHLKLIIVGPRGWGEGVTHSHPHVMLLGQVTDQELAALYTHALALISPSLYEGFGYPVIEAMLCECPVAVSDSSSLRELATDGTGLVFDPLSVEAITQTLYTLASAPQLRSDLRRAGKIRASEFTWEAYHTRCLSLFDRVLAV